MIINCALKCTIAVYCTAVQASGSAECSEEHNILYMLYVLDFEHVQPLLCFVCSLSQEEQIRILKKFKMAAWGKMAA